MNPSISFGWKISALLLQTIHSSAFSDEKPLAIIEARVRELQDYQARVDYRPTELPSLFDDGSSYRVVHNAFENKGGKYFRIEKTVEGDFKLLLPKSPAMFPADKTQITAAPGSHQIFCMLDPNTIGSVDLDTGVMVSCPRLPQAGLNSVISVGDRYVAAWETNDKIQLQTYKIQDGKCESKPLASFTTGSPPEMRMVNKSGNVAVYLAENKWGRYTGSDALEIREYDLDGKMSKQQRFPGFRPATVGPHMDPGPSVGPRGTLIALGKTSDNGPADLYLIDNEGTLKAIAKGAHRGVWTDQGDILVDQGRHAGSSDFVLYKAPQFTQKTKFAQPEGMKPIFHYDKGRLWYVNYRADGHPKIFEDRGPEFGSPKNLLLESSSGKIESSQLEKAHLPRAEEVTYPSQGRQVHSMALVPEQDCVPGAKRPVVVFLHGGNFEGRASSHFRYASGYEDLLFSQLGYPVVSANYLGDDYVDGSYPRAPRYLDTERQKAQLADIQAAGEYAKTLPCADPKRIILLGHSYGAYLASLYATAPEYAEKNPFAGVVIKNGMYAQKELEKFFDNPRVAFRDTDEKRQTDPKKLDCVYKPKPPITGVTEALAVLEKVDPDGSKYCGIQYNLSEDTLNEIVPARRTAGAHTPILVIHGDDPSRTSAELLAKDLADKKKSVTTWFPHNEKDTDGHRTSGHTFWGETEQEYVRRIYGFVNTLNAPGRPRPKKGVQH